jgi:hypothetical protein
MATIQENRLRGKSLISHRLARSQATVVGDTPLDPS